MQRIDLLAALWRVMLALALLAFGLAPVAAPLSAAAAKANITLSRGVAAAGDPVTVTGTGFQPNDTAVITATFTVQSGPGSTSHQQVSNNAHVDGTGAFSTTFKVPAGSAAETYAVSAKDSHGNVAAHLLQVLPLLRLKSGAQGPHAYLSAGQLFYVTGTGFKAGETVTFKADFPLYGGSTLPASKNATADPNGNIGEVQLQVPWAAKDGDLSLTATGQQSGKSGAATATITVVHRPLVWLTPTAVRPGGNVTVHGRGFIPGAKVQVSTTFPLVGGGTRAASVSIGTDGNGAFSTPLSVPPQAADGTVKVTARAANLVSAAALTIGKVTPSIVVAPLSAIPGSTVAVLGSGFLPSTKVTVTVPLKLLNGSTQSVSATATTDKSGAFKTALSVPGEAAGGGYLVTARSDNGRAASARLTVAVLKPSVVAVPTMAVPGTPITVNGFGFASGETVTVYLNGQKLGTATANGAGEFKATLTVPGNTATGSYTLTAAGSSGRKASIGLQVFRTIATHFYFASLYTGTGYHEYLLFVNTSEIRARVQLTYQPTVGAPSNRTITVNAHSRFTEDVNRDLGFHISASAVIATDVPISAERMVLYRTGGAIDPGTTSPSTIWYFADGNTTHQYHEYIAIQNPNTTGARVAVHFQPTHSHAFTHFLTMRPQSRTTVPVDRYVHDAVGVVITANEPVVANRTIYIHRGITSLTGVKAPQAHWYFATGPTRPGSRHWIGVINTTNRWSYLTLHAYGPSGADLGTVRRWIRPFAREGYLMNELAHEANVAVTVTTSQPSSAEQVSFLNYVHDAHTGSFGVITPQKTAQFAEATTWSGQSNVLYAFNPNLEPIPIVVQFLGSNGASTERTYVIPPLAHLGIDVGSVAPNSQLGLLAASNYPFVAEDWQFINNGLGALASIGTQS